MRNIDKQDRKAKCSDERYSSQVCKKGCMTDGQAEQANKSLQERFQRQQEGWEIWKCLLILIAKNSDVLEQQIR